MNQRPLTEKEFGVTLLLLVAAVLGAVRVFLWIKQRKP
jgi:hypothetical protein